MPTLQAGVTWRKAMTKLEGEEEYEALGKLDRLEAFDAYMRLGVLGVPPAVTMSCDRQHALGIYSVCRPLLEIMRGTAVKPAPSVTGSRCTWRQLPGVVSQDWGVGQSPTCQPVALPAGLQSAASNQLSPLLWDATPSRACQSHL